VVETNQLLEAQGFEGIGVAFSIAELDQGNGRSKQLDDGAYLATHQPVLWQVMEHRYYGKKFDFRHISLTLKNITSNKTWHNFVDSDHPATSNLSRSSSSFQFKVYYVSGSILIGIPNYCISLTCGKGQHLTKLLRVSSGDSKNSLKHPRFMLPARMTPVQTIVSYPGNLDNASFAMGQLHTPAFVAMKDTLAS
jgi:hypothetical protein